MQMSSRKTNNFQKFCIETIHEKSCKTEKNDKTLAELLGRLTEILRKNSKWVLKLPITFFIQTEGKRVFFYRFALELFN